MKKVILACLGVALTLVLAAPAAVAQGALGTSSADVMINVQPNASLTWILPSATYYTASLATGGVGLRSQRNGAITISGVTTPMQAAYVYWAVITSTTTIPTPVKGLTVTRLWPIVTGVPASQAVVGTLVGKGASPCWSGAQILVYLAAPMAQILGLRPPHSPSLKARPWPSLERAMERSRCSINRSTDTLPCRGRRSKLLL